LIADLDNEQFDKRTESQWRS